MVVQLKLVLRGVGKQATLHEVVAASAGVPEEIASREKSAPNRNARWPGLNGSSVPAGCTSRTASGADGSVLNAGSRRARPPVCPAARSARPPYTVITRACTCAVPEFRAPGTTAPVSAAPSSKPRESSTGGGSAADAAAGPPLLP